MRNLAIVEPYARKLFVNMTFGEWLKAQLYEKRLSGAELARRAGLSSTHISNLVRNFSPNTKDGTAKPSVKAVDAIAKALGVNPDEARLAAGYAPLQPPDDYFDVGRGVGIRFRKDINDMSPEERQKVIDLVETLIAGVRNQRRL